VIAGLAVLGASGDLAARYLLPALARLQELGRLPAGFSILGIARDGWSDEAFRRHMADELARHAAAIAPAAREAVVGMLAYRRADVAHPEQMARALAPALGEPLLVYLALPPGVYEPAVRGLPVLVPGSRVVIEKPFGQDLASARALNRLLADRFPEEAVFRIDHFLGMQTVQNILGLRFANRVFESLWSAEHVERVEIVWDETLALEGRAGYYDAAGALIDMIQNHLLQLLCLVAMEAPLSLGERDLRDRKADVLRAVRRLAPDEVARCTVRGRYTQGRIGERAVPAYRDEEGVDAARGTDTFAQVMLHVDSWRWAGVPFVLRSGKALARERREIAIHFRPVPHLAFEENRAAANVLRLQLEPERIALSVNITGPGERMRLRETALQSALTEPLLPAYARLLLDALRGDCTLAIRADEAEEAWRIIEPITRAWREGRPPLHEYPAGSDGPAAALRALQVEEAPRPH
jgi:glucose-6-phosphate 1-dehydrogenase